ncbi:MAG: 2,3,4,5-tetrahydropyridine-2,6-dicarboxylate N-succinyltransferase [Alphaproteobacteria bacterium]|nr:2,3,4,5-tetrahydropyridine-2,6-dicarboxylate N-succinyltransferase [Alphaproteobacteria bacterium]
MQHYKALIGKAWDTAFDAHTCQQEGLPKVLDEIIEALDTGRARVAVYQDAVWQVQEWLKKALLLNIRLQENKPLTYPCPGYDKIPSKFEGWDDARFKEARLRVVPGAFVRKGSYVAPGCVLMPSFINFGTYVGEETMIDIGADVGSCAQIGKRCHVSAGVVIGGVVEPLQAAPVILEDHVFVGAQSAIVEGVLVQEGAVIGMGVKLGASTPIFDRASGKISYGVIPPRSVVVPGCLPSQGGVSLYCAVIIKQVDAKTREKTAINDLLRP